MGDNKLLKMGFLAMATAAAAAGSAIFADKSLKKLVKGVLSSEQTTLRKPVEDEVTSKPYEESVIREPSKETIEILPQINLNQVSSIIENASLDSLIPEAKPAQEPPVELQEPITYEEAATTPAVIAEVELPAEPIMIEEPMQQEPQQEEIKPEQVSNEKDYDITPTLPYLAGKLETLYEQDKLAKSEVAIEVSGSDSKPINKPLEDIETPIADSELEKSQSSSNEISVESDNPFLSNDAVSESTSTSVAPEIQPSTDVVPDKSKQEISSNPFLDLSFMSKDEASATLPQAEEIEVTSPLNDEPVVAYIEKEEEPIAQSEITVSGPYLDEQLPQEPSIEQVEPKVELPEVKEMQGQDPEFGEPILSAPFKVGKTMEIGNSIVSDEPYNQAISIVASNYPNVSRDRLVSIIARDGAGIVFEFSSSRIRNEDTLSNVYSVTAKGEVSLPRAQEQAAALDFGRAFITDMPQLGEFLNK